jgi:hypothetical protein
MRCRTRNRPLSHALRRARPALEGLEDRTLPSTFLVTNLADSGLVKGNRASTSNDDVFGPLTPF